jgi:hypothetical protein
MQKTIFSFCGGAGSWAEGEGPGQTDQSIVDIADLLKTEGCDGITIPRKVSKKEIDFNKKSIFDAMKSLVIEEATVKYEGYGDSGGVESVEVTPKVNGWSYKEVTLIQIKPSYQAKGKVEIIKEETTLNDALSTFTESIISHFGYDGYENDSGGGGCAQYILDKDAKDGGKIRFQHYYLVTKVEEDEEVFI